MKDFLRSEYEQCMSLVKYYDERQFSLFKYSATIASAVPNLLVAIFKLGEGAKEYFWRLALLSSLASAIAISSIFLGLVQTRLYFVYPVRQVNAIRAYFLKSIPSDEFENQMYLSTTLKAFKWLSSQTLMMAIVALEVALFFSCAVYSSLQLVPGQTCGVVASIIVGVLIASGMLALSGYYLHTQSVKAADKSVHRES